MNIGEAEIDIRRQLQKIYDESEAANIASMIMEKICGFTREQRIFKKEEALAQSQLQQLQSYMDELRDHKPVQYVLNEAWFFDMPLYVDQNVLIPRPETEELVQWVINDVKNSGRNVFEKKAGEADKTTTLKILDIGTGSGCIALALKKAMPGAEVWGCDISEDALNIARRNGASLDIRVDFQGIDFLDEKQQKSLPTVDIAVSNPPYIPANNKNDMARNVLDHEPHLALFVRDEDPLIFYRSLARFGRHRLYDNGNLYMEIHEDMGAAVKSLFETEGYSSVELRKDMQGKERMIKVTR